MKIKFDIDVADLVGEIDFLVESIDVKSLAEKAIASLESEITLQVRKHVLKKYFGEGFERYIVHPNFKKLIDTAAKEEINSFFHHPDAQSFINDIKIGIIRKKSEIHTEGEYDEN